MLGNGFRMFGNMAQSILYATYDDVRGTPVAALGDSYNTMRAVSESSVGLGWGSYFGDANDFHFDLTVGYDFNIYWDQYLCHDGHGMNVYLQGLNVGMRFDF